MLKNFFVIFLLFPLLIMGLSGCSSTPSRSHARYNYTGKYNYHQVSHLPNDYPTRSLPDGNMWDDFRRTMGMPLNINRKEVQAQIRWLQTHKSFVDNGLLRGAQYLYYVYLQTKKRHLPAELALIPVFESGYVPVDRSSAGAVGLWQFMYGTAKENGIRINKWYDGRRDVVASTDAALRYFTYLYYYFDKDWLLVLAAYNWGPGSVQMAMLRNKRHGLPANYWSLHMPRATQIYVPRLLALAIMIQNPAKYHMPIVPINNAPYFDRVDVGRPISLDKAAKMSGTGEWTIRMLNAGYSRGVTEPSGPYAILLPRSRIRTFKDRLNGNVGVEAIPVNIEKVQKTQIAKVDVNEQVEVALERQVEQEVASAAKVATAQDFPESKSATKAKDVAKAKTLLVSNSIKTTKAKVNHNSNRHVSGNNNARAKEKAKAPNQSKQTNVKHYVVGRGETLFSIARQYGTSASVLRKLNHLKQNNIKVHQVLLIPMAASSFEDKNGKVATKVAQNASVSSKHKKSKSKSNITASSKSRAKVVRSAAARSSKRSPKNIASAHPIKIGFR